MVLKARGEFEWERNRIWRKDVRPEMAIQETLITLTAVKQELAGRLHGPRCCLFAYSVRAGIGHSFRGSLTSDCFHLTFELCLPPPLPFSLSTSLDYPPPSLKHLLMLFASTKLLEWFIDTVKQLFIPLLENISLQNSFSCLVSRLNECYSCLLSPSFPFSVLALYLFGKPDSCNWTLKTSSVFWGKSVSKSQGRGDER